MKLRIDKKQKGQALVETAIMLPLLTMVLVGVGYFGTAITTQHNLSIAARYVARNVAIDSTIEPKDRTEGSFFKKVNQDVLKKYALDALPNFDPSRIKIEPVSPTKLPILQLGSGSMFRPIALSKGFAYVYTKEGRADAISTPHGTTNPVAQLRNMKVGVGAVFFGVKISYRLKELDWMSTFLFKRKDGITLDAISFMPAELPLRTFEQFGLMEINDGLYSLIRVDVRNPVEAQQNGYVDLVKE